eukprot:TRINITY_DN94566_c0_g1_i2.p1 TRINITY_DN94566_c0_g1~~TRINITY_DN94566_c0_g1_i2.p1  ORF type:complete len:141 (+),score=37.11 TRINITY_DN94566_c0_g1_i2:70-492(+)
MAKKSDKDSIVVEEVSSKTGQFIEQLRSELSGGLKGTFQLNIRTKEGKSGGSWYLRVDEDGAGYSKGKSPNPTVALTISDDDFLKLAAGKLSPMQAFMQGKLKIKGNLMTAAKAEQVFSKTGGKEFAKQFLEKAKGVAAL